MRPHLGTLFRHLLKKHGVRYMLVAIRKLTSRAPGESHDSYSRRLNGLMLVLGTYFRTRCGPTEERSKIAYCVGYNATDIFEALIYDQPSPSNVARMLLTECVLDGMLNNGDPQASSWLFMTDEFARACTYISRATGVDRSRVETHLLGHLMAT